MSSRQRTIFPGTGLSACDIQGNLLPGNAGQKIGIPAVVQYEIDVAAQGLLQIVHHRETGEKRFFTFSCGITDTSSAPPGHLPLKGKAWH